MSIEIDVPYCGICPRCRKADFKFVPKEERRDPRYPIIRCGQCGYYEEHFEKCDYCLNKKEETKLCVLKNGTSISSEWSEREMNICESCRRHLHGFFKYVRRTEE